MHEYRAPALNRGDLIATSTMVRRRVTPDIAVPPQPNSGNGNETRADAQSSWDGEPMLWKSSFGSPERA